MEDIKKDETEEKTFENDNNLKEFKQSVEASSKKEKKEKKSKQVSLIDDLNEQIVNLKDQLLRNQADVENFKKRIMHEKVQERKYAALNFISTILDPIDRLLSVINFKTDDQMLQNFLIGFKMISDQFLEALENEGVQKIKSLNEKFNPSVHQAVEKVHLEDKDDGIVVEVLQDGYQYKDRLIRPAMVKVNERIKEEENGKN